MLISFAGGGGLVYHEICERPRARGAKNGNSCCAMCVRARVSRRPSQGSYYYFCRGDSRNSIVMAAGLAQEGNEIGTEMPCSARMFGELAGRGNTGVAAVENYEQQGTRIV